MGGSRKEGAERRSEWKLVKPFESSCLCSLSLTHTHLTAMPSIYCSCFTIISLLLKARGTFRSSYLNILQHVTFYHLLIFVMSVCPLFPPLCLFVLALGTHCSGSFTVCSSPATGSPAPYSPHSIN